MAEVNLDKINRSAVQKKQQVPATHGKKGTANGKRVKKSAGKQLLDNFIADDLPTVGNMLVFDVIIPAAKELLFDIVSDGISTLLFGDSRYKRDTKRYLNGVTSKINYSTISTDKNKRMNYNHARVDRYMYDDILFDSRGKAADVLASLYDILDEYDVVTVADFYETAMDNPVTTTADLNWGWEDLSSASIAATRDGYYYINLPKVRPIK